MIKDLKISFIDRKPQRVDKGFEVKGKIEIGNFWEFFYSSLNWWSMGDYEKQWQEGIERLKTHDTSCLIVCVYNPKITRFVDWWPLYKVENKIFIRNQMLMSEIFENQVGNNHFNAQTCYDFILARNTKRKVSEWVVDYSSS